MNQLTFDFLAWLAAQPRTYAEAMDAWRTSCPRLAMWEDALNDGLTCVNTGRTLKDGAVTLTPRGQALLNHL